MKKHTLPALLPLAALALISAAATGCQSTGIAALDAKYNEWGAGGGLAASIQDYLDKLADKQAQQPPAPADTPGAPATPADPAKPSASNRPADAAPFASFAWPFGGFNGSAAVAAGGDPIISGLSFSATGLSFRYDVDLSAWGIPHTTPDALACLFVQRTDGAWGGGKFDWISSSRTTRGFAGHVIPGGDTGGTYIGWSLAGVPNPCKAAFVIVSKNGRQRSNVIVAEWRQ